MSNTIIEQENQRSKSERKEYDVKRGLILCSIIKASDWVKCSSNCPLSRYTSNHQIVSHLRTLADEYPLLAQTLHVGKSVLGQDILGIRTTREVGEERELLKPKVNLDTFNTSLSFPSRLGILETCMAMNQ